MPIRSAALLSRHCDWSLPAAVASAPGADATRDARGRQRRGLDRRSVTPGGGSGRDRRRPHRRRRHERGDPRDGRCRRSRRRRTDSSSSRASSTRTCTSSTAASAWRRCSCATRGRARSSSRASRRSPRPCRPGTWITGGDWDHTLWGGELPRARLDRRRHAGPSGVGQPARRPHGARQLARRCARRASTRTRRRRRRRRDRARRRRRADRRAQGQRDGARRREVPPPDRGACSDRALDAAMTYVAAQGVTSVHHMGTLGRPRRLRPRARKAGALTHAHLRRRAARHLGAAARHRRGEAYGPMAAATQWLRIGGLKGFVDGSLGSHTAAFQAPFTDAPKDRGLFVNTPEDLYAWTSGADKAGLQVIGARHRRPRHRHAARHLRARRAGRTARATGASASSTRSTSRRPTSRASPRSASSPACSRITPSTTGAGPRRSSAPNAPRRPTPSARCSTPARRSPSAATGSSRRRRRSRASTPR